MTRPRWEPFEGINTLRREINRVLEGFLEGTSPRDKAASAMEPVVEVLERPEVVVVKVQVPGVRREDLHVSITGGNLMLKGELKEGERGTDETVHQQEFRYGDFSRTIALPKPVRAENATARLTDGVLVVTLPISTQTQEQTISIQTDAD